jgi:hypothetical protein
LRAVLQPPQSLCRRAGISLHSSTNSKFRNTNSGSNSTHLPPISGSNVPKASYVAV